MGGKKGIPSAKEKEAVKAKDLASQEAAAKEDAAWAEAGEGKRSKAQAKRSAKDDDRQQAQAKKLEAKRMAEEEAAALASSDRKAKPVKVTRFELEQQKEHEKREASAKAQQSSKTREVDADQYNKLLDGHNANMEDGIDAHNVDEALAQLTVAETPKMKFSQYLERELVQLKIDKPGLKAPQYKDVIWKKWIRSPENPLNQKAKV
eukprot:jgi/Ulvmu1/5085/UM021_0102.1